MTRTFRLLANFIPFCTFSVFPVAAEPAVLQPIDSIEMMTLDLPSSPLFHFPIKGWKFLRSDDPAFANPDFDDRDWDEIEVNKPLNKQAPRRLSGSHGWYRLRFTPPKGIPRSNLELRLGCISAGDEVYLNGRLVAEYGFHQVVNGSSVRERRYQLSGAEDWLRPGENLLAIRVKIGYLSGMYRGIPEIRQLPPICVFGHLGHKAYGPYALQSLLTENPELNHYSSQEKILLRPQLSLFSKQDQLAGILRVRVYDAKQKLTEAFQHKLALYTHNWLMIPPLEISNPGAGSFQVRVEFQAEGAAENSTPLWSRETSFQIIEAEKYILPPAEELQSFEREALPLLVNDASFGSFGPRQVNDKNQLFDDYRLADSRAGSTFVLAFNPDWQAPMIFQSSLKPMPGKWSQRLVSSSIGSQHDGFENAWSLGLLRPSKQTALREISTQKTTWTSKKINYLYADQQELDIEISQLTPAWKLRYRGQGAVKLFSQRPEWGLGGPSKLLLELDGQLQAQTVIEHLPANWLLVSFAGGKGWDEFDLPWLLVFEKRAKRILLTDNGIDLSFQDADSGLIQGMPLFGVTPQSAESLPPSTLELCRFWSRALIAMPLALRRSVQLDYEKQSLFVRDEFQRPVYQDAWQTVSLKLAPVPPIFLLAAAADLPLRCSRPSKDLDYALMMGPLTVAENVDCLVYEFSKITHFVQELREVQVPDTPANRELQAGLEELASGLLPELRQHPWKTLTENPSGKPSFGGLQPEISNLLLALPHLSPETAQAVRKELLHAARNTLFNDSLLVLNDRKQTLPINTRVVNPINGKTFSTLTRHTRNNGIDCPCWEALRLYLFWDIARTFNEWDFIRDNWELVQYSYDLIVNSHDWAHSISWDSYAGLRVGNGFQENSIFHAGLAAYARMAHSLGYEQQRDQAAYYSLMQLPGLLSCAAPESMAWLRKQRPWLLHHSCSTDINWLERTRPNHHLEFNERIGLFHYIIHPRTAVYSHGVIMTRLPEIMRPFRELWPEFIREHIFFKVGGDYFSRHAPPPLDSFVYLLHQPPFPVEELFQLRQDMKLNAYEKIADWRALLDSRGHLQYRKLW